MSGVGFPSREHHPPCKGRTGTVQKSLPDKHTMGGHAMRFTYTETFPQADPKDAEAQMRMIRKIVEDRLADEILKHLRTEQKGQDIA
jgi:hypothetical protein